MIKNYESLVDEIIETIEDAIETPRDIYVSWYIDPENGEWYSDEEADSHSAPEEVWTGHDKFVYQVNMYDFNDVDSDEYDLSDYLDQARKEIEAKLDALGIDY